MMGTHDGRSAGGVQFNVLVQHVPFLIDGRQPPGSMNARQAAVRALGRMKKEVTAEVPLAGFVLPFRDESRAGK
jgi:hypothetical protein